jgi:hypothetical protein
MKAIGVNGEELSLFEGQLLRELYNDYPAYLDTYTVVMDGCYGQCLIGYGHRLLNRLEENGYVVSRRIKPHNREWTLGPSADLLIESGFLN